MTNNNLPSGTKMAAVGQPGLLYDERSSMLELTCDLNVSSSNKLWLLCCFKSKKVHYRLPVLIVRVWLEQNQQGVELQPWWGRLWEGGLLPTGSGYGEVIFR